VSTEQAVAFKANASRRDTRAIFLLKIHPAASLRKTGPSLYGIQVKFLVVDLDFIFNPCNFSIQKKNYITTQAAVPLLCICLKLKKQELTEQKKHNLADILFIAICSSMNDADSWIDIITARHKNA
jgi:K+-sensing histidine kinase KdpD